MERRSKIPDMCDFDCPFADFAPADTAGICRTMSAVWCKKLRELVNKNAACEWKRRNASGPGRGAERGTSSTAPARRGSRASAGAGKKRAGDARRKGKAQARGQGYRERG